LPALRPNTIAPAAPIARLPQGIRGYDPVKERRIAAKVIPP